MSLSYEFGSPEFDKAVFEAGRKARAEALAAGRPVFCLEENELNVMECPDGRRFEIRWIPGAPAGENFEILRELKLPAA